MPRKKSLNPENITIAEEMYETGAGNMTRRRSLPPKKITYVPSILILKLVPTSMELPKEIGRKQKRFRSIVCKFSLRKGFFLDFKENLNT